jgi:predicted Zn-dependent peptidase
MLVGELACELLCGDSSPLYAQMYGDGLINKTFGGDCSVEPNAAYLVMGGECQQPETLRNLLIQEAARLAKDGIEEDRFLRTRRACYGSRVRALNSFEHICVQLARGYFRGNDYFTFGQVYESITRQEVAEFLVTVVTESRSALSVVTPISSK